MAAPEPTRVDRLTAPDSLLAWQAACLHTSLEAITRLGSIAQQPDADPDGLVAAEIKRVSHQAIGYWNELCKVLDKSDATLASKLRDRRAIPEVIQVHPDGNIEIRWPRAGTDPPAFFNVGRLNTPELPFAPRSPFQPVRIERLPAGTVLIDMTSDTHVACAAATEVFRTFLLDARAYAGGLPEDQRWDALQEQIQFYASTARLCEQNLGDDQYRGWSRSVIEPSSVGAIPDAIAQSCSTVAAVRSVALGTCAAWFAIDATEAAKASDDTPASPSATILQLLAQQYEQLGSMLDGYNRICAKSHNPSKQLDLMIPVPILRPMPEGRLPVLALLPASAGDLTGVLDDTTLG